MRQLERERRGVWVARYSDKEMLLDEDGRMTGEYAVKYGKPELFTPTVSARTGNSWGDGFGMNVDCDRAMVLDRIGTGIDETCVAWVDVRPELDEDGLLLLGDDGLPTVPNDYRVVMAGESFNYTHVAIKKVD